MPESPKPIAILAASPARRGLSAAVQGGLGLMLIWFSANLAEPAPFTVLALLAGGLGALYFTRATWTATARQIVLTRESLTDSAGNLLARVEDIERVDRGVFAFKPSNGFVLTLKTSAPRGWAPGLWWRIGRRVGIGGTVDGRAARDMSDLITVLITGNLPLPDED